MRGTPMIVVDGSEHTELRAAVRKLLEHESPLEKVVAHAESDLGFDRDLWRRLAQEIGVAGLAIPEQFGGIGATAHEQVIVAEELGRSLACTPFLASVGLAANLLLASGDGDACAAYLPAIAAGESTAAVAYRGIDGAVDPQRLPISARATGEGWLLSGEASYVVDGHSADLLLVLARVEDTVGLFAVDAAAVGLTRQRMRTLDHTRAQATIRLADVAGSLVGELGAWPWLEAALLRATVLLAAEQVGGADVALETAVEYAKLRVQFGRKIGSFQAIKHRLADVAVENDRARSAVEHAAWAAAFGTAEQLQEAAAMAALVCGPAFVHAAQESIQVHGGIGFTWEHQAHRYFRRAKADLVVLQDPAHYPEQLLTVLGV
jgi:alkylation response protein AidB-like acyl-CoA dehydrogenase